MTADCSIPYSAYRTMPRCAFVHLYVLHPGELRFALDDNITALPAREIPSL